MMIKKFFKERLTLLVATLLPAYMFFLHAPLEIYLTNSGDFWFTLADFGWLMVAAFAVVWLLLFLVGAFLPKVLRTLYSALGVAGGLCVYIQGNFLNADLGTLNGSEIIWSDYQTAFIINLAVWIGVIVAAVILCLVFKEKAIKVMSGVGAFVLLMQVVTLGTLFLGNINKEDSSASTTMTTITDKDMFTVSKDENVLILVLDMFDNEYMREILKQNPETKETFKDFTFFDNAVGSHSTTAYSMGTILTGQKVTNTGPGLKENVDMAYEKTTLFDDLAKEGFVFDTYTQHGMTPQKLLEMSENYETRKSFISDNSRFVRRMYRLVSCRFAPNILKQWIWMSGTEFDEFKTIQSSEYQPYIDDNYSFYKNLQEKGISLSDEKRFKVIHLNGVHFPYLIDSNVNPIPSTSSPSQTLDTAKGALKIAEEYINGMKEQGAYDNSTIILLADHGFYNPGVLTNPLIMVKRAHTHSEFTVSQAPVSHYDIHATIMDSLNLNEDGRYGKSMFDIQEGEERNRIFYQHNLGEPHIAFKYTLLEWAVDDAGNARKYFRLTGTEIDKEGNVLNHADHCSYCQKNGLEPVDALNAEGIVHDLNAG